MLSIESIEGTLTYGLVEVRRDRWANWVRKKGRKVSEKVLAHLTEKIEWRMYSESLFDSTLFPYLLHHSDPRMIEIEGSAIRFCCDRFYGVGSVAFVFENSEYIAILEDEKLVHEIKELDKEQ